MCCTIGEAELSNTKIYVGEAIFNNKYVHTIAYQNSAITGEPNAMVIPFPASQPMTKDNIIETESIPNFLENISDATKVRTRGLMLGHDFDEVSFGCAAAAEVFEHGSYTVILASHAAQIPEALLQVSENKRPKINIPFLIGYGKLYPKQPIAVCCWSGNVVPEPLLWWYEPTDKNNLFIPTMDAHDGKAPDLKAMVNTDHIISVGSNIDPTGSLVNYQDKLTTTAQQLLPKQVHGHQPPRIIKNGDTFVNITELKAVKRFGLKITRGADINNLHYQGFMNGWM